MSWQDAPIVGAQPGIPTPANVIPTENQPAWMKAPVVDDGQQNFAMPERPVAAHGIIQSFEAGMQGSSSGLMWRQKLPNILLDPESAGRPPR